MKTTNHSADLQARLDQYQAACRKAGLKQTIQRQIIFEAVARSTDHPDAEAVFTAVRRKLPSVSLDTVYRTLWLLADLGLIATLGAARERVQFDGNMTPHHHFTCTKCGETYDFYHVQYDNLKTPSAARAIGQVQTTQVELRGVCNRCAENKSQRKSTSVHQ